MIRQDTALRRLLALHGATGGSIPETVEVSGNPATFETPTARRLKGCKVILSPIQAGSGDPAPDNIRPISGRAAISVWRTGLNMFVIPEGTKSNAGVSYTYDAGTNTLTKSGTSTGVSGLNLGSITLPAETYTFSADFSGETGTSTRIHIRDVASNTNIGNISKSSPSLTLELDGTYYFRVATNAGETGGTISSFMLARSDQAYVQNYGEVYSATFPETVYGGTVDTVNGILTINRGYIASYDGETLPGVWLSDRDVYAEGTTPTTGAEVVYELPSPITRQIAGNQIVTLAGTNMIWSDAGGVTVKYRV